MKNDSSDLAQRLKEFEGSIGTSRYALKLVSGLHSNIIEHRSCLVCCLQKGLSLGEMAV